MSTEPSWIEPAAQPVQDAMHVEHGATPDGRLLLYFTFAPPVAAPPQPPPTQDTPPRDAHV